MKISVFQRKRKMRNNFEKTHKKTRTKDVAQIHDLLKILMSIPAIFFASITAPEKTTCFSPKSLTLRGDETHRERKRRLPPSLGGQASSSCWERAQSGGSTHMTPPGRQLPVWWLGRSSKDKLSSDNRLAQEDYAAR